MKLFDDDEDPCPPKDDEARDRFEADMAEILAEILAEEKRTECPAAKAMREAAAKWIRYQFGEQYCRDGLPLAIPPCDAYAHGRADMAAEAAAHIGLARLSISGLETTDAVLARLLEDIYSLAPASPTHVSVRREVVELAAEGLELMENYRHVGVALRAALPGGTDGE